MANGKWLAAIVLIVTKLFAIYYTLFANLYPNPLTV